MTPPLALLPHGLTKQQARCVEALAYLEPGGWQSITRLGLPATGASEEELRNLKARGLVARRWVTKVNAVGNLAGRVALWCLTPEGWALARECGWPAWADDYADEVSA